MKDFKLSVIIPCFNEEKVIDKTYKRVKHVLLTNNYNQHEIIFINDGSKDKTSDILSEISFKDDKVKVINFSRNFGQYPSVSAGINYCTGDIAFIIDADLQDPPELFPEMIKVYNEQECNVVYGVRKSRKGESFFTKITSKLFYRFINYLSDIDLPKDAGDFRLIDKKVINEFKKFKEQNKYIRGLISWIGFKQCPFYFDRESRLGGETKKGVSVRFSVAANSILYFSKKPLNLAIILGFISFIIGLIFAVIIIIQRIFDPSNSGRGWPSIIITIIFFGGVQLISVGLLGKYLGSVFDEVKQRPEYIVDNTKNMEK
jgi:polyisoprenyl-phosphate glycosyltransferase